MLSRPARCTDARCAGSLQPLPDSRSEAGVREYPLRCRDAESADQCRGWDAYSECPRQRHAGERATEAEQVVAENIREHQTPLSLLEIGHCLVGVARERGERSAEADDDQQSPARIDQNSLRGPDHEESNDEAADDVDGQSSVRKNWAELLGGE